MKKQKFYSLKNILSKNAQYNIIFGERSLGKTYACLKYGIEKYFETGAQFAIVRRWQDDFTGKRGQVLFDALINNDEIAKASKGQWTNVHYYASKWYFCKYEGTNKIIADEPFAYGFALTSMEHDKSLSYPKITTVIFDEFITRTMYLPDEFVLFMNVLSTIIRHRKNVKIFMLGNTVNKYCPYFAEMGLKNIKNMTAGTIDVYRYGDSDLTVAVEYTEGDPAGKESDLYFAFNNPQLSMIKSGDWELPSYPHAPCKWRPKDVLFSFFIIFEGEILQGDIIKTDWSFLFIHRKSGEIKNPDTDLIFTLEHDPRPNYSGRLNRKDKPIFVKIWSFFNTDKVFFQDNDVGDMVRNFIEVSK